MFHSCTSVGKDFDWWLTVKKDFDWWLTVKKDFDWWLPSARESMRLPLQFRALEAAKGKGRILLRKKPSDKLTACSALRTGIF